MARAASSRRSEFGRIRRRPSPRARSVRRYLPHGAAQWPAGPLGLGRSGATASGACWRDTPDAPWVNACERAPFRSVPRFWLEFDGRAVCARRDRAEQIRDFLGDLPGFFLAYHARRIVGKLRSRSAPRRVLGRRSAIASGCGARRRIRQGSRATLPEAARQQRLALQRPIPRMAGQRRSAEQRRRALQHRLPKTRCRIPRSCWPIALSRTGAWVSSAGRLRSIPPAITRGSTRRTRVPSGTGFRGSCAVAIGRFNFPAPRVWSSETTSPSPRVNRSRSKPGSVRTRSTTRSGSCWPSRTGAKRESRAIASRFGSRRGSGSGSHATTRSPGFKPPHHFESLSSFSSAGSDHCSSLERKPWSTISR